MATIDNTIDHVETSIETAQGLLDRAQKVVTGLDDAHQRVEHLATVLRQATIGVVAGGVLLGLLVVLQRRSR